MNKKGITNYSTKQFRYYKYTVYSLFAFPLIFVLILLPVAPVFADEIETPTEVTQSPPEVTTPEPVIEEVSTTEPTESASETASETEAAIPKDDPQLSEGAEVTQVSEDTSTSNEATIDKTETIDQNTSPTNSSEIDHSTNDTDIPTDSVVSETEVDNNIPTTTIETVNTPTTTTETINTPTTTIEIDNNIPTTTTEVVSTPTTTVEETATSTEPLNDDLVEEGVTEEVLDIEPVDVLDQDEEEIVEEVTDDVTDTSPVPEAVQANIVFNDDNRYQFSKDQCISMGDGSFYCMDTDTSKTSLVADGVYAAPDADGDKEIFMKKNGESIQITHNTIDDDAPYYDEISNTIVWHSLMDGRYQINQYDLKTEKFTQLTSERYNNMYPSRDGDVIVWQGWVGNDWEIMLEEDGELTMITDNNDHDISPRINANHIIWQSFEEGLWRVKVYDINTGITETISDSDGGSVENPRFVLVYDTKFDNGDIETKGYDLRSGESVPLSSTPTPLPAQLPDPDPTDEQRALVAPPVQVKTKSQDDGTDIVGGSDPDPDLNLNTNQATSTDDVVIPPYMDDTATSTEQVSEIEELIITPYVEDIVAENDSAASSTESLEDLVIE